MARIRSVKPEFWEDQELAEHVSRDARLLYIGLWNLADEHGRLRGDPRYVKGRAFPYDDDLDLTDVAAMLGELAAIGKVVQYQAGSGVYIYLPNLGKHQRLEADKVPSKLPSPYGADVERLSPKAQENPDPAQDGADLSAPDPDESAPGADEDALLYVAGSMEHGVTCASEEPLLDPEEFFATAAVEPAPLTPSQAPKRNWSELDIESDPKWGEFWAAYPLKKERRRALKAWLAALKRGGVTADQLVTAALSYRNDPKRDPNYTKHPTTWLNGSCWQDEPDADPAPAPSSGAWWNN